MSAFGDHPWLSAQVVPLAWCWRIERRDGVVLGLTTHDRSLVVGGLVYRPEPGIKPSAIRQRRGIAGNSFDIAGALSASSIAESDLLIGRWSGAQLTLLVVDWQMPDERAIVIADGRLGTVTLRGGEFTAELAARDTDLQTAIVPETSAECRSELGDRRCRIALIAHRREVRVMAIEGRDVFVDAVLTAGNLAFGRMRVLGGAGRGTAMTIIANDVDRVTLAAESFAADLVGQRIELTAGCDRRLATCAVRFDNAVNFRGEPHLPGIDLLTRFAGG